MSEQLVIAAIAVAAIVVGAFAVLFLGKNSVHGPRSSGPDPGGTFGGIPDIAPGMFDPGTAPPPTYEVTDHVRAYDDQSKPKEER